MLARCSKPLSILLIGAAFSFPVDRTAQAQGVYRTMFSTAGRTLMVEVLDDDLAHFELSEHTPADAPIEVSPMIFKTDYVGPSQVNFPAPNIIETPDMQLTIDVEKLCITVTDLTRDPDLLLTTVCPMVDGTELQGLSFTQEGTTDLYGLGEQFQKRGGVDLLGQNRSVLNLYGNEMNRFSGGLVGNAQFPILYALGEGTENYALFLDSIYQQFWSLREDPFTVKVSHVPARWYLMTGPDLPDLRRDYMELTGFPPVPPLQLFGLWVSEFGYESWDELNGVLDSLRAENFPVDGFVLDLQWFGGITPKAQSQMGSLAWDEGEFPDPADHIADLRETYGLGIITIEEPYVSESARGYEEAAAQGVLVRECEATICDPVQMNEWWGIGSMVDWTNPDAGAWWFENRREHLIDAGVIGHWTDLGEPENYDETGWYYGFPEAELHTQADVHNIYNLLWSKSIWERYSRNGIERRPFILSRSGTAGSQRYGVAMWSGDIGSNLNSLTAQMAVQMQMSLSGIDYFGSDVGGFHRDAALPGITLDELYTIWLANSVLLDVPLRPHAFNLQNNFETAPSLIGDVDSNVANVRLRYELSPYLYSLAHYAYRYGDPVFAPLVYAFQNDPNVRELGNQKMIGPNLMMAAVTSNEGDTVPVYLPAGGWFNYYTHTYINSTGEWIDVSTTVDGIFRVPLFVREGAVIPLRHVDEQTLNMLGQRADGSTRDGLIITVYGDQPGSFTLIEDDGETMAYQAGAVQETPITFDGKLVEVGPATGKYRGAPEQRIVEVRSIAVDGSLTATAVNMSDIDMVLQFTFTEES